MSKKKLRDIVQNNRSVRNISDENGGDNSRTDYQSPPSRNPRKTSSKGLWFIAGIALVFLFFLFSVVFSGTKIVVYPKTADVTINTTMSAQAGGSQANGETSPQTLGFEVMTVTKEGEKIVAASGEEYVEQKAQGRIRVYNDYSGDSQRLIDNTRFESPDGRIYRIRDAIVVPGQSGGEPGSIEVTVYADRAGADYNLEDAEFTIPGLEGDPRYEHFWAETVTPISGGYAGERKTVAKEVRTQTEEEIRQTLEQELLNEAYAQKPDGYVLFEDAIVMDYRTLPDGDVAGDNTEESARIRGEATLSGIIFSAEALSMHIAQQTLGSYDGAPVMAQNLENLAFTLHDKQSLDPGSADRISFDINGETRLVWQFDDSELRNDFANQKKDAIDFVLTDYPSIERAEVVMRPFWKRAFPEDPDKINIETVIVASD